MHIIQTTATITASSTIGSIASQQEEELQEQQEEVTTPIVLSQGTGANLTVVSRLKVRLGLCAVYIACKMYWLYSI